MILGFKRPRQRVLVALRGPDGEVLVALRRLDGSARRPPGVDSVDDLATNEPKTHGVVGGASATFGSSAAPPQFLDQLFDQLRLPFELP